MKKTWIQTLFAVPLVLALLAICLLPLATPTADAARTTLSAPAAQEGGTWEPRAKKGHLVQEPGSEETYCLCNAPNPNCSPCWEWVPDGDG